MNRRTWICAASLAALASCAASTRPHLVNLAEVQNVRVYVRPQPMLTTTDEDCRLHYGVLEKSLPYAVRKSLTQSGFSLVRDASMPHDAEAVISGNFSYCRKSGTCVNGSAEVTLVASGRVLEGHRYDTGNTLCSASPTVDEFAEVFVASMRERLLDSQSVASFAQAASVARAAYPAGALPVAQSPATAAVPNAPAPVTVASPRPLDAFVQGAPQPQAYALVVGIETYRDVPAPIGARADAAAFARLAERTLGLPSEHVRLLLDEHATRGDLEKALAWLELNVPAGGRIFFFYSGHGAPDPVTGTSYLLPYDGDPAALDQTALPLARLTERLAKTRAAESLAFIDACFSGAGGRSVLPRGARPLVRVQQPATSRGVFVLASSSGSEISGATADGTNGLFTKYLLQGLGEALGDLDGDLQISLGELSAFIEPRVARDARLENRLQTPTLTAPDGAQPGAAIIAFGVKR